MKVLFDGTVLEAPQELLDFCAHAHTAVVSIDMHDGHLSDDPDCPCPAPRAREIVAPINAFHAEARARGIPVIHVRSVLRKGGQDDINGISPAAWRSLVSLSGGEIPNIDEHAIEGTRWTEFATHVAPEDLIVETKRRLSAFYPTDLDFLLRSMGIRRVVFNGGMTDACVLNATFDASNIGYRVAVVGELTRGNSPEMEAAALKIISMSTGVVMTAADVLARWDESAAAPRSGTAALQEA